ncbi:MAG: hypothetical protein AB7V36_05435 [Bacteroidales bacterium]
MKIYAQKTTAILFLLFFIFALCYQSVAQDSIKNRQSVIYTFIVNKISGNTNIPLVGFVNISKDNHKGCQIGFTNFNKGNFSGAQIGFINTVGKKTKGAQVGFLNTSGDDVSGSQTSFINIANGTVKGVQTGFINIANDSVNGSQLSFINIAAKNTHGAQIGFVNNTEKLRGLQLSFINTSNIMNGFQLGFINYTDSIEKGIPLGFVSIVKNGGYRALEVSTNNLFPINLACKLGVKKLYTNIILSYVPGNDAYFSVGLGLGTIVPISCDFFFNPEVNSQSSLENNSIQALSMNLNAGYQITPRWHLLAGPSFSWEYKTYLRDFHNPAYYIWLHEINEKNRLILGLNVSLRYQFSK